MNPANAKFVCGAECGLAVVSALSGGVEHWSALTGTPTVVTSGPATMRSARAYRFNTTAAAAHLTNTFATVVASPATTVFRLYVYFATFPSASTTIALTLNAAGTNGLGVFFVSTDNTIRTGNLTTQAASGVVVTTGRWYRIDCKGVYANPALCDADVTDMSTGITTACTQYSVAGANSTSIGMRIGSMQSITGDFYIDDVLVSGTSGDYRIGDGTVVGLYPNGDRTNTTSPADGNFGHVYNAVGDFGKGSAGGTNVGAQNVEATAWQSFNTPLPTATPTNMVTCKTSTNTEHMVFTHDSMPPAADHVNGVMCAISTHSATATANVFVLKLSDASGNTVTAFNVDLSESTITTPIAVMATAPNAAAWTPALVDGAFFRFGDTADASPVINLNGVCLEVDYTPRPVPRPLVVAQAVPRAAVR